VTSGSCRRPSIARIVAMVCVIAMAACVTAPRPSGPPSFAEPAKGLPLPAGGNVVFLVASDVEPPREDPRRTTAVSPIGDTRAVADGLRRGFLEQRPDAKLLEADEGLRSACFDLQQTAIESWNVVLPLPDPSRAGCKDLLSARNHAYLVTIGGARHTSTSSRVEYGLISAEHGNFFRVLARTFDAATGAVVCEGSWLESAASAEGVAFLPFWIPVPWARILEESAFWSEAGLQAGRITGRCFVAP
jgi:hypothetical protein